jgi:subtilisin-like proprotein convertase family protein
VDFARLEVAPVRYDPVAGELEVIESLELRVRFTGGSKAASQDLWASTYSPFFEGVYGRIDGAKGLHDDFPDHVRDEVTYVIITPTMFTAQLADFIAWKTERGFRVIVGEIGSPEVGTTTASIQGYIHGLYHGATPDQPAPSFVLFVGDVAQCPTWQVNGDATDRPYCTVDGDYVPDIYYGRFSATNTSQLQAILDKTMMYDQYTMPDPSYLDDVVLIAGYDSSFGGTHGNGTINYGTANYFNAAHGLDADVHLYPQSGSDDALIVSEVSQGRAFVNYTAHGSQTSWSDPTFTQANINSLQNEGKYGLAIGNCCLTSTYDYGECFAETWLRAPNKGMIGYIGGSNSTYWDEDVWWATGYTPNISANIPYESTELGVYDALFHEHGESEDQWYVTQDAIVFCGNLAVQESGSSRTNYYWNIYNLMGDPSIAPYIGVPSANTIDHAPNLVANMTGMTVAADAGSYVGVTQDGVLIGAGTVHASRGAVDIVFRNPLTAGVPAKLVIMAQNRVPYVTEIPVAAPSVVAISPLSFPAGVATTVTVSVMQNDGVTPIAGVAVQVADAMEFGASATTNSAGQAQLTIDYPYGGSLDIVGTHPTEGFMFGEQLTVTAAPLSSPDITVATEYGLVDVLGMNLQSTITATTGTPGATLVAYVPGVGRVESATGSIVTTPLAGGEVTAYLLREGHDLYREAFAVLTQGSVRGVVSLEGEGSHDGVTITAQPGGHSTVTAADGSYLLTGLDAGAYTITAERDGFSVGSLALTLAEGEHRGEVDFALGIVYEVTECAQPALSIPDNDATGVSSTVEVTMSGEVTSVRAFVGITHTYQGDLRVQLTSPSGTTVVLHDRSGSSADNILGWYPDDLGPAGNLDAFLGEEMQGAWRLTVSDHAGWDTGTLDEWCVNIGYSGGTTTAADGLPTVLSLGRNFPNPFNPQTTIDFAVPRAGRVSLAVFDLRGRRVAELVNGDLVAGHHEVTWRGQDDTGRQVASGTYFYRLTADGEARTGKMLLVK